MVFRTILNEEQSNRNSHTHFKDRINTNEQTVLASKSNTSTAASSFVSSPPTDDIVPPKPVLPNKNGLASSRLPS
jgi:hypothetical protein